MTTAFSDPLSCRVPQTLMRLSKAILIYESGANGARRAYATVHEIEPAPELGARPQLMPGVPVTRTAITQVLESLSANEAYGFLPDNILAVGPEYLVWWSKPQVRNVWFNSAKPIGTRCGKTPHPGLVFAVIGSEWAVFAVKGDQRPNSETELCQVPYFNVWDSGRICTGNVTMPGMSSIEQIQQYEQAFFNSYFTHPNIREKGRLTRYRGGPFALWNSLLTRPRKTFPDYSLVPLKRTAGELVQAVITKGIFAK